VWLLHFDITYTFLADKSAVDSALQQVQKIQNNHPTEVRKSPLVELPKIALTGTDSTH